MVEAAAKPLTEMNHELGLGIQPADTRLLRISTFAYDTKHDSFMDGAFKEEGDNRHVVLIYTDRACVISGEITLGEDEYTLNISLPSKGFHYILTDDNNYASRRRARKDLLFVTDH